MPSPSWEISADTGGTFTDCLIRTPEGLLQHMKVLSSSRLRGTIVTADGATCHVKVQWPTQADIFVGYHFLDLSDQTEYTVVETNLTKGTIRLDKPIQGEPGAGFEIYAYEEPPILAARLATNTPLNQPLPPITMRLGSTRGTNALLEKKGARVAFVITRGFKDLLRIGTQERPDLFAVEVVKAAPLHSVVFEVDERIGYDGEVVTSLSDEAINQLAKEIQRSKADSVAISFLNSYRNPDHENRLAAALISRGQQYVTTSSALSKDVQWLPRATTAVVNAYLHPVIERYLAGISAALRQGSLMVMTSAGGLSQAEQFTPKDSLLSGPAGGVVGAVAAAKRVGVDHLLTLDMGGTSTDVARYSGQFDYQFRTQVGGADLHSPSLAIHTIAAGGGSKCFVHGGALKVGPESEGARPGPACYGVGGGLTLTDVNLLLGYLSEEHFAFPVDRKAAEEALSKVMRALPSDSNLSSLQVLTGFREIANEKMAEAMRQISIGQGVNPSTHAFLAFGGAGGQHACAVASLLEMKTILFPFEAGLLSAAGIQQATIERTGSRSILTAWSQLNGLDQIVSELVEELSESLKLEGLSRDQIEVKRTTVHLRLLGQDSTLEVQYADDSTLPALFEKAYHDCYGYAPSQLPLEVESVKVVAGGRKATVEQKGMNASFGHEHDVLQQRAAVQEAWQDIPVHDWKGLKPGSTFMGPALVANDFGSLWVEEGWMFALSSENVAVLTHLVTSSSPSGMAPQEAVALELYTNRFKSIAANMGALLKRTAFSVNIKERLDFSCALLNAGGELVVNAPHIPVHLGGIGLCVRDVAQRLTLEDGDVVLTNHPGMGGSHLPDLTLIAPVFSNGKRIGFVANRAHHAELGGTRPGSMPPDAKSLAEEGVVFDPIYVIKAGVPQWQSITDRLEGHRYPSRSVPENLADLRAGMASLNQGKQNLQSLCAQFGADEVAHYMDALFDQAEQLLNEALIPFRGKSWSASTALDDGHLICVKVTVSDRLTLDFTGTSPQHPGNLNATPAIVNSAVIYVLRLLVGGQIPLNEGIMRRVSLHLPTCFLNPDFPAALEECPAVVGGNTETSQRIVEVLMMAFGLSASSQGTMNNVLFGNDHFGYYETIGGGTGAGPGFPGCDGVHSHMTNTRITDPEIMELRYPVRVKEFSIRPDSGGEGQWLGGDGLTRKLEFLEPLQITVLSQHRKEGPAGMAGGASGAIGYQHIERVDGSVDQLQAVDSTQVQAGDTLMIATPGGGGYGKLQSDSDHG